MAISIEQRNFLSRGGVFAGILEEKRNKGEMVRPEDYQYQEYPKYIRIPRGTKTVKRVTTAIRGKNEVDVEWDEEVELFDEHIVNNEADEEAVLSGGKSAAQLEQERSEMIASLRSRGINVDPTWTTVRLQREMGAMPPREAVEALAAKVEVLEREAALRARIAELESQLTAPVAHSHDETEDLREHLRRSGVDVDRRWSLATLRQKVEALDE